MDEPEPKLVSSCSAASWWLPAAERGRDDPACRCFFECRIALPASQLRATCDDLFEPLRHKDDVIDVPPAEAVATGSNPMAVADAGELAADVFSDKMQKLLPLLPLLLMPRDRPLPPEEWDLMVCSS